MYTQRNITIWLLIYRRLIILVLATAFLISSCTKDYPAAIGNAKSSPNSSQSNAPVPCTSTIVSSTTAVSIKVDTLAVSPPRFTPNGGALYFNTVIKLTADSLLPQAVYEYSLDKGQSWQTGQQFAFTVGGNLQARFRIGNKVSRARTASFSIYFQRLLVIGNSIMLHPPSPPLGWYNNNGMAASAPEKDFVHLLTGYLTQRNPQLRVQLQYGNNFETNFGKPDYSLDEFNAPLQSFQPDLIVLRIGENVNEGDVLSRGLEEQLRQLVTRLVGYGRPVKLVTTTSVWNRPLTDAAIRKVVGEKALPLVDFGCFVNHGEYFASQYSDPGVAAHPNDAGMQEIANQIWAKVQ